MSKKKRFNVEFRGKAWMRGTLTIEAKNEQDARANAMASYMESGVEWKYVETDEEYDVRIVEVDPL